MKNKPAGSQKKRAPLKDLSGKKDPKGGAALVHENIHSTGGRGGRKLGGVDGESTDEKHRDEIEVLS